MRRVLFVCLFLCLSAMFLLSPATPAPVVEHAAKIVPPLNTHHADSANQARILDSYGKLPLSFEANHGQSDDRVKFLSRSGGYTVFLTQDEAVLAFRGREANAPGNKNATARARQSAAKALATSAVLRMKLRQANPAARITGVDELPGKSNYFIGNDPAKWRSSVPTYSKVKYEEVYSGIDVNGASSALFLTGHRSAFPGRK